MFVPKSWVGKTLDMAIYMDLYLQYGAHWSTAPSLLYTLPPLMILSDPFAVEDETVVVVSWSPPPEVPLYCRIHLSKHSS